MKLFAALLSGALALVFAVAMFASGPAASTSEPSGLAFSEIPPYLLPVYVAAADTCEGLPWQVLAAIGFHESRHGDGRINPATGDVSPPIIGPPLDGRNGNARIPDPSFSDGWAHALGPMQFIPSTWKQWGRLAPNRPAAAKASPQNAWDEIYSAAAYLCGGRPAIGDLRRAILSYDDSEAYVQWVLNKAAEYGMGSSTPPSNAGAAAVAVAMRELGVPYVYGGESPDNGFDCSGLVQWAYAQVGVSIPRVTLEQVRVGTPVSLNDLQPGDLIFTRGDVPVVDFGHVAMYVGGGVEINAPHTGAVVSLRAVDPQAVQAIRRVA